MITGKEFKQIRKRLKLTQQGFARALQVSNGVIQYYEKRPTRALTENVRGRLEALLNGQTAQQVREVAKSPEAEVIQTEAQVLTLADRINRINARLAYFEKTLSL